MSILPFRIQEYLRNLYRELLDFLFPQNVFEMKLRTMTPSSFVTHSEPCLHEPKPVSVLYSYKNHFVRNTIHTLKYRGNTDAARLLGTTLYDLLLEDNANLGTYSSFEKPLIIPIPLSPARQRSRGYNQVELVTHVIATLDQEKNFSHTPHALIRIKNAPSQTALKNKTARIENLAGAFRANPALVSGKAIILIDDVVTTGTTLKEARRALKQAGARKIRSYALAH